MLKRPGYLVLASAVFCAACILLNGCTTANEDTSDEGLFPLKKGAAAGEVLKELEYSGVGTITGTVTYDGDPPAMAEIPGIAAHADRAVCYQGDVKDQTWKVDAGTRGVENVVVFVRAPKGTFFKKPDDALKSWRETVEVDQPFCQFQPHVLVLYPQYYDGKGLVPTGQKLKVLNTAAIGHNIKVGGTSDINPAYGSQLSAKTGTFIYDHIRVDKRELSMNCDVHKWMAGYALTFDHPYAARTNPDGTFEIKNVPAGVELTLRGWHEDLKQFDPGVAGGTRIKLEAGKTLKLDFKIKKR